MKPLINGFFRSGITLACVAMALLLMGSPAHAASIVYGFGCVNGGGDCSIASQFSVAVESYGTGSVLFTISNLGPIPSSITAVYWDDDAGVLDISTASPRVSEDDSSTGVIFSVGGKGSNLPGGNTIGFFADTHTTRNGSVANGINPEEWLGVVFDLESPFIFSDVTDALNSDDLRMGLHVQAIGSGSSGNEGLGPSFVTAGEPLATPEPTSLLLLGTGLGVMGLIACKRNRK